MSELPKAPRRKRNVLEGVNLQAPVSKNAGAGGASEKTQEQRVSEYRVHMAAQEAEKHQEYLRGRRGQRFQLRASSAIERARIIVDRNVELRARLSDQMIPSVIDDIPVKLAPVDYRGESRRMICVVFRAMRTMFAHTKEVLDDDCLGDTADDFLVREDFRTKVVYHNDHHLIEKHFGVHYEAVPGKRVVITAQDLMEGVVRHAVKEGLGVAAQNHAGVL